jgi:excisionase family DNA binding protein
MKGFYTTRELADELGVTVGRVRQMIVDGLINTEKMGRDHLIPAGEIEKARQRKTTRGPEPTAKAVAAKRPAAKASANGGATKAAKKKGATR